MILFFSIALSSGIVLASNAPTSNSESSSVSAATLEQVAQLPLAFEENRGQAPEDTRFIARAGGYQVHVSSSAMAIALTEHGKHLQGDALPILRVRLVGAREDVEGAGVDRLASTTNYFLGSDAARQFTDVANYARVRFDEVYPGIGLVYYGNQSNLEYDIVLQPGADPTNVRLALDGANDIRVDQQGNLLLSVGSESLQLKIPVVYQEYEGKHHAIAAKFQILANHEIGIRTAKYDHHRTLTIDPTLVYSTYVGGGNRDLSNAIAVDSAGNAYIAGTTYSTDFPMASAYQSTYGKSPGATQAFVTKLNATGTALIYSTYLGDTSQSDAANGIAVDASGYAYVTGTTSGSAFPTTSGAYQTTRVTGSNSFVAKLGPAGNTLSYGTYLNNATTQAIALDSLGNAYVTGTATSAFKTTAGAFQATALASSSPFVFKLNLSGTTALYATFLGGSSGTETATSIAVDSAGSAYIGGGGRSTDFPTLNAFQSALQGGNDGYVAKLNPQGSALVYSTHLGGTADEVVNGIAVDANGSAYVTGQTTSFNFPVSANSFQRARGGPNYTSLPNAFVAKLAPGGNALVFSSYLGGGGSATHQSTFGDWGTSIAIDSAGHAFVAGEISSTTGFPLVGDLLPGMPENEQGLFVAKIGAFGDTLLYSTHIGWTSSWSYAIAVDPNGDAYATAAADSGDPTPDNFLVSSGAYRTAPNGTTWEDAIVTRLTTGVQPAVTLGLSVKSVNVGQPLTASISVSGSPTGSVLIYDGTRTLLTVPLSNGAATASLNLPVGVHGLTAVYRNNGAEGLSSTTYVAVNQPATCN